MYRQTLIVLLLLPPKRHMSFSNLRDKITQSSAGNFSLRSGAKSESYAIISMSSDFKFRTLISIWSYTFHSPFTSLEDFILGSSTNFVTCALIKT